MLNGSRNINQPLWPKNLLKTVEVVALTILVVASSRGCASGWSSLVDLVLVLLLMTPADESYSLGDRALPLLHISPACRPLR